MGETRHITARVAEPLAEHMDEVAAHLATLRGLADVDAGRVVTDGVLGAWLDQLEDSASISRCHPVDVRFMEPG